MSDAAQLAWMQTHEWVQIPANTVRIGSCEERLRAAVDYWSSRLIDSSYTKDQLEQWLRKEYPEHQRELDAFMITRFPITNGQFRTYLELRNQAQNRPESLRSQEPDDHPVWGVSLQSCASYCRALTMAYQHEEHAMRISLPSEFQWEYAAKGLSDNEYPYGPTFQPQWANSKESGQGWTTSVRRHEDHPSPMGVCDMAGNVEEWTCSLYRPYPGGSFIDDDLSRLMGDYHVIKGGSFCLGGDLTRCARRHGPHPDSIFRFVGFRITMQSP
jgi:toxoflavin biosynthesis protein ToxD